MINNYEFEFYLNKLKNKEYFSFTRYGDGEWHCINNTVNSIIEGKNCDGHHYFPEMREGLQRSVKNDRGYYKARWPENHQQVIQILGMINNYLNDNHIKTEWVNATVWENLMLVSGIELLVKQLEKMNYIIVSESKKRELPIKYKDFVEVPLVDCYLEKDRIKEDILKMCDKYESPVFGFSASMATNVIIDELYDEIGDKCWMIDFGSIWDPFIGNRIRSWHDGHLGRTL